jgi:hypothetical protein
MTTLMPRWVEKRELAIQNSIGSRTLDSALSLLTVLTNRDKIIAKLPVP